MSRQLLEFHPRIGYRFIPGVKARVPHETGGYFVRANAQGFRSDHDFDVNKPSGMRRVLLFGDSFTAGDGVSNGKRYGDVLESQVSDLQVYNFGLPGTGTDQQYLAYKEFATEIRHDLLVIGVLVENIRRVVAHYRVYKDDQGGLQYYAKPYYELVDGELTLFQSPPAREPLSEEQMQAQGGDSVDRGGRFPGLRKLVNKSGLREVVQKVTRYQPVPEYDQRDHPAWLLMAAILTRWIREHSGPVMLMPLPLYHFIEGASSPAGYQARFRELAAATGCLMHDPLPDLSACSAAERRGFRFEKDVHLTAAGHAAIAQSLAPAVERALGAVEGR